MDLRDPFFASEVVGIVFWDSLGNFPQVNDSFLRMLGWTRAEYDRFGIDWHALTPPAWRDQDLAALGELLAGRPIAPMGKEFYHRDGHRVPVIVGPIVLRREGDVLHGISFILDRSREQRLEEQLRQTQRMESLGRLTGGIAHDFNNVLTGILGASELLQRRLAESQANERRLLAIIHGSAAKASDLVRRLLAAGRQQRAEPATVHPCRLLGETVELLRPSLGPAIAIDFACTETAPPMLLDAAMVQSAVVNLAVNARDAMPAGGRLTIAAELTELAEPTPGFAMEPGLHLRITVADTGCGIAPEHLERVFEPFFTTKDAGKGNGLGLASAYAAVVEHHGSIAIASEPGKGTTCTLLLPVVRAAAVGQPRGAGAALSGRYLLVDDDPTVTAVVVAMIEQAGGRVHARPGPEALAPGDSQGMRAAIVDMIMPGGGGPAAVAILRAAAPDLPILLCSGHAEPAEREHLLALPRTAWLAKPFTADQLAQALARLTAAAVRAA